MELQNYMQKSATGDKQIFSKAATFSNESYCYCWKMCCNDTKITLPLQFHLSVICNSCLQIFQSDIIIVSTTNKIPIQSILKLRTACVKLKVTVCLFGINVHQMKSSDKMV